MISLPKTVWSQHFESPQFQTWLCSDQDKALVWNKNRDSHMFTGHQRLSSHKKSTYDDTTVKPQLATVSIKFFAVWLSQHSPIGDPLFRSIFMYQRTSSATWKPVSSVNAKWPFGPLWHVAVYSSTFYGIVRVLMFYKSVMVVSFSCHLLRMHFIAFNCIFDLWRLIFPFKIGTVHKNKRYPGSVYIGKTHLYLIGSSRY